MNKNISEEVKREVLNKYMNTRKAVTNIAKDFNLSYQDIVGILEEYTSKYGNISRNVNKTESKLIELQDEQIYNLRKQGFTYKEIVEELEKLEIKTNKEYISQRCKKIFFLKSETEPEVKRQRDYNYELDKADEEIYNLRKQGLSYQNIVKELEKHGIKLHSNTIRYRCEKIFSLKGETESKLKRNMNEYTDKVDEEIYNLRKQGLSYQKIVKELEKHGIKLHSNTIRYRCEKIFSLKGETEPKLKSNMNEYTDKVDEEIYNLRKQGLSYQKIVDELEKLEIKTNKNYIRQRCKEIFNSKGETEPEVKRQRDYNYELYEVDELIYNLRKQRLSYAKIVEELKKQDIEICMSAVLQKCKEIFKLKGETEPEAKRERSENSVKIDEIIYNLRKQGKTYGEIVEELKKQDIEIGLSPVYQRCKKIFKLKGETEPEAKRERSEDSVKIDEIIYNLRKQGKTYGEISESLNTIGISISGERIRQRYKRKILENQKDLAKMILNLTITRKATMEQIQQIADYYEVDLEETLNSLEER